MLFNSPVNCKINAGQYTIIRLNRKVNIFVRLTSFFLRFLHCRGDIAYYNNTQFYRNNVYFSETKVEIALYFNKTLCLR